jgi:hypothetical protein
LLALWASCRRLACGKGFAFLGERTRRNAPGMRRRQDSERRGGGSVSTAFRFRFRLLPALARFAVRSALLANRPAGRGGSQHHYYYVVV